MHFRPGMCLIVPTLPVDLADCAAEPVPPLHLVDAEAKCGHLRQDAPDAYLSCINEVAFTNEMRIESRQRYLNDAATEVFASAPVPPAPAPFVPEPAELDDAANLEPLRLSAPPAPVVLCVGQIPIPGGSNADGIRLGCQ